MRLTQIEIENFKGVGEKQTLDLAPITLLFGPNSAGKSTILQALQYVRAILEGENPDPDPYVDSGDVDYGGFKNLVHGHDLSRKIYIGLRISLTDDLGSDLLVHNDGDTFEESQFQNLDVEYLNSGPERKCDIGVGLEISWSADQKVPYVSRVEIKWDGQKLAEISGAPQEGFIFLSQLDYSHSLIQPPFRPINVASEEEAAVSLNPDSAEGDIDDDEPSFSPVFNELTGIAPPNDLVDEETGEVRLGLRSLQPAKYRGMAGAMLNLNKKLSLKLPSDEDRHAEGYDDGNRLEGLTELLDDLILGPLRVTEEFLGSVTHIGPIRDIPDRDYRKNVRGVSWYRGLAAWDLLLGSDAASLVDNLNAWLSGTNRLDIGYEIITRESVQVPADGPLNRLLQGNLGEDDLPEIQNLYRSIVPSKEVKLWDLRSALEVYPADVGVGISQVIPVVLACLSNRAGLIATEQPELHIHPRVQLALGDLFIDAIDPLKGIAKTKSLLIETHSEHIILRLTRRIEEANKNQLPPGAVGISSKDISVIYVQDDTGSTEFKRIHVSDDGEFLDKWPHGFFEERRGEFL